MAELDWYDADMRLRMPRVEYWDDPVHELGRPSPTLVHMELGHTIHIDAQPLARTPIGGDSVIELNTLWTAFVGVSYHGLLNIHVQGNIHMQRSIIGVARHAEKFEYRELMPGESFLGLWPRDVVTIFDATDLSPAGNYELRFDDPAGSEPPPPSPRRQKR